MLYIDDLIASDPKIIKAGRLLGEKRGGRCAVLGLYLAAIAYCRQHLTDGVVPLAFLQELSPSAYAISALHRAKLVRKLRDGNYLIPPFLKWNKSAAQIKHERKLSRERLARFRNKQRPDNAQETPLLPVDRGNGDGPPIHDPRSTIPDLRSPAHKPASGASTVRSAPLPPVVPTLEQRPGGRRQVLDDTQTGGGRTSKLTRTPAADGNYAVLVRLAHAVMDECHIGDPTSPDLTDRFKEACAQRRIAYEPTILHRALRSAAMQRLTGRPLSYGTTNGPLAALANTVKASLDAGTLPDTVRAITGRRR